jgi:thiol:disulfide interchange protein
MSMPATLAAAFLGGVILNFMPCVFPVISLKAFGLIRHLHDRRAARVEGLAFLAGVVVTMLLLCAALLAARASGAAVGWGFQLQSPVLIATLALVMLALALNMMGVFEIGLAAQRLGNLSGSRTGPLGAALTGALAIIVATPCTAPFMAGAVGAALLRPPVDGVAIFVALALGFAAPFTTVALVPACARLLPKPGAWMATLKHVLAFPMLGAAAWLAWVLDRQGGSAALGALLAASVVLGLAAWVYGLAQRRQISGLRYRPLLALPCFLSWAWACPWLACRRRAMTAAGWHARRRRSRGHRTPSLRSADTASRSSSISPLPGASHARSTIARRYPPRS